MWAFIGQLGLEHNLPVTSMRWVEGFTNTNQSVLVKTKHSNGEGNALLTLLGSFRECASIDPKDNVYAMLGLAKDVQTTPLPDHSLPAEGTCHAYGLYLIGQGVGHGMLTDANLVLEATIPELRNLPSWVPRWNEPRTNFFNPGKRRTEKENFHAGGTSMPEIRVESNSRKLRLKGVHLDDIEDLGPILLSSNNFANLLEWEKATRLIALESQH